MAGLNNPGREAVMSTGGDAPILGKVMVACALRSRIGRVDSRFAVPGPHVAWVPSLFVIGVARECLEAVLITGHRMPSHKLVVRDVLRGACGSVGAVLGAALLVLAASYHVLLVGAISAAGGAAAATVAWQVRRDSARL